MPQDLADRARRTADRQRAAQTALVDRMRTARREAAVVRRLGNRATRSAYVDTRA